MYWPPSFKGTRARRKGRWAVTRLELKLLFGPLDLSLFEELIA